MDVVDAAAGGTPDGDIGAMQVVLNVAGAGYILGGLLFGIALFRTAVLPRWASALLAVSTVSTAALAVLPDAFNRPLAVPEGIALIGLGVALWRNPRDAGDTVRASAGRRGPRRPRSDECPPASGWARPRRPVRPLLRPRRRRAPSGWCSWPEARSHAGRRPVPRAGPVALVVHIVGVGGLRPGRRLPARPRASAAGTRRWHRRAGRVLAVAGLMVAGSALWLTLFYDAAARHRPPALRPAPRRRLRRWPAASSWASPRPAAATSPPTARG